MNLHAASCVIAFALALSPPMLVSANDASALRLIPFPKEVSLQAGSFRLERPLVVRAGPKTEKLISEIIISELRGAGVEATAVIAPDLDDRTLEIQAVRHSGNCSCAPGEGRRELWLIPKVLQHNTERRSPVITSCLPPCAVASVGSIVVAPLSSLLGAL